MSGAFSPLGCGRQAGTLGAESGQRLAMCVGKRYQKEEDSGRKELLQNGWEDRAVNFSLENSVEDKPVGPVVTGGLDRGMNRAVLIVWASGETPIQTTSRWASSS